MNPLPWLKSGNTVKVEKNVEISPAYTRSVKPKQRGYIYLLAIIFTSAAVWAVALVYLKKVQAKYVSGWTITIPGGSAANTSLNLPNIGEASSQNSSAYAVSAFDPRENYKAIVTSDEVLKTAAQSVNIPLEKFGSPRVKIVDNTTLMNFEIQGYTPEEAREKSVALHNALELRLNNLRKEEIAQQNERLEAGIEDLRKKLKISQNRLSQFKLVSGLNSNEQITKLVTNIEDLRKQRAELVAQEQQQNANQAQISKNLSLSSEQASDAFVLQADPLFQKYQKSYNEAQTKLISLSSKFLPSHPTVITQKTELESAEVALVRRGEALLGRPFNIASINKVNFGNSEESGGATRTQLSEKLVTVQAQQQGIQAQVKELDQQILLLENRLKVLTQRASTLEELKRDVQISETVFSSTIAKLDLTKSTVSTSYPPIQVLSQPSLPDEPIKPKPKLILLGAAVGSLLISSGILMLWRRDTLRHRFREEASSPIIRERA